MFKIKLKNKLKKYPISKQNRDGIAAGVYMQRQTYEQLGYHTPFSVLFFPDLQHFCCAADLRASLISDVFSHVNLERDVS